MRISLEEIGRRVGLLCVDLLFGQLETRVTVRLPCCAEKAAL